ncbi:MAG: hypothetical protein GY910_03185 [bacterium]|nr:hypothetical protein [Deltaproteobacteria bacterium]MCP4903960.1 hypothetical protein [bacterium]
MGQGCGAPYPLQPQGETERDYRTLKNVVELQHDCFPSGLIGAAHYDLQVLRHRLHLLRLPTRLPGGRSGLLRGSCILLLDGMTLRGKVDSIEEARPSQQVHDGQEETDTKKVYG